MTKLKDHLLSFVHATPLNTVIWSLQSIGLDECGVELLDIYEKFLISMNDIPIWNHLAEIQEKEVYKDTTFLECREISHQLQSVLKKACFEQETPLREFITEYGLF